MSASSWLWKVIRLLDADDWRDLGDRKAGEEIRGEASGEGDNREEKRRSNG